MYNDNTKYKPWWLLALIMPIAAEDDICFNKIIVIQNEFCLNAQEFNQIEMNDD